MSLEIHLQTNGVGTSECIEHTVCRIPVVAVAIVGVHDIGIVEEVVHVAEEGGIQVANLEAVAGIQVKLSSSRHLPGGGIGLVATVGSRDGEVSIVACIHGVVHTDAETVLQDEVHSGKGGSLSRATHLDALQVQGILFVVTSLDARGNL